MRLGKRVTVMLLGVTVLAGCGTADREASATAAANQFVVALAHPDQACQLLAPRALNALERDGRPCADALAALRLPAEGRAREVTVWAARALVHTGGDTLFLIEEDTGWRVIAAGCVPAEDISYECVLAS